MCTCMCASGCVYVCVCEVMSELVCKCVCVCIYIYISLLLLKSNPSRQQSKALYHRGRVGFMRKGKTGKHRKEKAMRK